MTSLRSSDEVTTTRTRSRLGGGVTATFILSGVAAFFLACSSSGDSSEFPGANADGGASSSSGGSSSGFLEAEGGIEGGGGEAGPATACGNGVKNADTEICDDGNAKSGDGCSAGCRVEDGWLCTTPGTPCVAIKCGDHLVAGAEDCDDGNTTDGDGCSATCRVEVGFKCDPPGTSCSPTTCGDNKKEGVEQCDDGNRDPFDGCDPDCHAEPKCAGGTCTAVCGDGLRFSGEACDDGNTRSGDGCSATCAKEPGYTCVDAAETPPASRELYIAYRDFKARASAGGHPDFMNLTTDANGKPMFQDPAIDVVAKGLVQSALDAQGKPQFLSSKGSGTLPIIESATTFGSWYRDTAYSKKYVSKLTLTRNPADGSYSFDNASFFPLDGVASVWPETQSDGTKQRNFLFTSELRIPFKFNGGETLTFRGDDDVWVYVNGQLVVDLGGVKNSRTDSVTLDPTKAAALGLTPGGMYEFVVFQAERNPTLSSYRLTLLDFDRVLTKCTSVCGDGVKTPDEVCDDGAANNTGAYGKCAADCTARGPFCGDGIVQADHGEQCDSIPGCSADCRLASNAPK
ncbi:MAG: hypothetical protein JWP97_483 [Labilithrix sp.]|nr:hypothetical protein [Labilithrix sp.]